MCSCATQASCDSTTLWFSTLTPPVCVQLWISSCCQLLAAGKPMPMNFKTFMYRFMLEKKNDVFPFPLSIPLLIPEVLGARISRVHLPPPSCPTDGFVGSTQFSFSTVWTSPAASHPIAFLRCTPASAIGTAALGMNTEAEGSPLDHS